MGNCVFKGFGVLEEEEEMVKVATTNGGIMELFAPVTAECITNEFPGHAIYKTRDLCAKPLLHNEQLHAGQLYYLLPINTARNSNSSANFMKSTSTNSSSSSTLKMSTPYRMSFDNQRIMKRPAEEAAVFPRYNSSGVWKVKLVISPEQLAEILAQEARTEELIESVRTVAKCGNGGGSSVANSDQCSVSSSWKGSSDKYGGIDLNCD